MRRPRQIPITKDESALHGFDAYDRASYGYAIQEGFDEELHVRMKQRQERDETGPRARPLLHF